jgi:hypothetical protein
MREGILRVISLSCRLWRQPDDQVEAGVDLLEQQRDVGRIVLQVTVHRDQHFAVRMLDARRHRGRLAVVATELDDTQPRIVPRQRGRNRHRVVLAAVVDENHLERPPQLLERSHDRLVQRPHAFLFVVERHDDRQVDRMGGPARARCALCCVDVAIGRCTFCTRHDSIQRSYNFAAGRLHPRKQLADRVFPSRSRSPCGARRHRRLRRATLSIVGTSPARAKPTYRWSGLNGAA